MRPFHGLHQPKPASASQFFVSQSSLAYGPNETVTVQLATDSDERFFRGFLVQAYDPANGKSFGRFQPTDESQPLWCSAATHRNHSDKRAVVLRWQEAPVEGATGPAGAASSAPRRQVRFRATIVVTYSEFYTGFESSERSFAKWDFSKGPAGG